MGIPNSQVVRFTPRGITDSFDSTDRFPGACRQLTNLIFDQSNPELMVTRPGVEYLVKLYEHGFSGGFISIQIAVGSRIYGMIAGDGMRDTPFCWDIDAEAVVPITGATLLNTPLSPVTHGAEWVPPTMAVVGVVIVVTHPGYTNEPVNVWTPTAGATAPKWGTTAQGGSNAEWGDRYAFGIIDLSDPAAPVFSSTTTKTYPLTGAPRGVVNFSNRAYFAVDNIVFYTDVLTTPLTITSADQQVTIGDSQPIMVMAGLPVQTTGSGMLQTMTILKETQVWQLAGDAATWNLSLSYTSLNVGTNAPRTLTQSPFGLYFSTTGGIYFLDLLGTLRAVTHSQQELAPDIQSPFANAVDPTRWCAAYNSHLYRVAGIGLFRGTYAFGDYWFDEQRRRWNGPHSFYFDCASAVDGYFVLSSYASPGSLFKSVPYQNTSFVNEDLGTSFNCNLLSATLPKLDWVAIKQVIESTVELAASEGEVAYLIYAQDEFGRRLGSDTIFVRSGGTPWGDFYWADGTAWGTSRLWGAGSAWGPIARTWGSDIRYLEFNAQWAETFGSGVRWGTGQQSPPGTYPVEWDAPVVFEKIQLRIDCVASAQVGIGTAYLRVQKAGYMTFGPKIVP